MSQRNADVERAGRIYLAETFAGLGATSMLVERVTGFGSRLCRGFVHRHKGPLSQRPRDALYFDESPARRLDSWLYWTLYLDSPSSAPVGVRLLDAYLAYRAWQQPGVLDINDCAQVVDLCQSGKVTLGSCKECRGAHLVFFEDRTCPECSFLARTFCRNCHAQLSEGTHHTTVYCPTCSTSPQRIALLRRARRRKRSVSQSQVVEMSTASPQPAAPGDSSAG